MVLKDGLVFFEDWIGLQQSVVWKEIDDGLLARLSRFRNVL